MLEIAAAAGILMDMTRRSHRRRAARSPRLPVQLPDWPLLAEELVAEEPVAEEPVAEEPAPLPAAPAAMEPDCCTVRRERRREGTMILVLSTHAADCPVWTAR